MDRENEIEKVLGTLSERERDVLRKKFGIDLEDLDSTFLSHEKFLETRRKIREIERKALRKLKPDEKYVEPHGVECSFCFKLESEVYKMIKDPSGVNICNKCVEACSQILHEDKNE